MYLSRKSKPQLANLTSEQVSVFIAFDYESNDYDSGGSMGLDDDDF